MFFLAQRLEFLIVIFDTKPLRRVILDTIFCENIRSAEIVDKKYEKLF